MSADSRLETLRDNIVARLESKEAYRGVTILSRKKGDLLTAVLGAIAKSGVAIIVSVNGALTTDYESEVVLLDPVDVIIEISENVRINQSSIGTGKGAMSLAESLVADLQFWAPWTGDPLNQDKVLMGARPGIRELPAPNYLPPNPAVDPAQLYILAVHFRTKCELPPRTD